VFAARFGCPLLSSGEFSIGVEVFGEFLFVVGFLWNFSLFMFGLGDFLVHVFLISLSFVLGAPSCSSLRGSIRVCFSFACLFQIEEYFSHCNIFQHI
jgi:hypothetical protein